MWVWVGVRELLNILSASEATVWNTWFVKKSLHKQTCQHPRSKRWQCIDFAVMQQKDRKICLDVVVKRDAESHTEHQLLCVTVRVPKKSFRHKTFVKSKTKRLDVAKLARSGDNDNGNNSEYSPHQRFQEETVKHAQDGSLEGA